jgi:hypothetical protein
MAAILPRPGNGPIEFLYPTASHQSLGSCSVQPRRRGGSAVRDACLVDQGACRVQKHGLEAARAHIDAEELRLSVHPRLPCWA